MSKRSSEFAAAIMQRRLILAEGAVVERLRRDPQIGLDPFVANAGLLYTPYGRQALSGLWREYIDIARSNDLEIIVYTPTWRVNAERLKQAGLPNVQQVAQDAFELLSEVRDSYTDFRHKIFIGGLVGCKGDAYAPAEALDADAAEEFHSEHVAAFAESGIDFLLATTLPALSEAIGIAKAISKTEVSYGISFVVRETGTLLDGVRLEEAIAAIDASVDRLPVGYFANCVHPQNFYSALVAADQRSAGIASRFVGIQGNASRKSPEELDESPLLETDDPTEYAQAICLLSSRFNLNVLGGCCGTSGEHITAIARETSQASPQCNK